MNFLTLAFKSTFDKYLDFHSSQQQFPTLNIVYFQFNFKYFISRPHPSNTNPFILHSFMDHGELLDKIWNAVKDNDLELMKVLTKDLPNDGRQLLGGFNYQIDKSTFLLTPEKSQSAAPSFLGNHSVSCTLQPFTTVLKSSSTS